MQAKREKNKGEFIYRTRKGVDENELHTKAKLVEFGVKSPFGKSPYATLTVWQV